MTDSTTLYERVGGAPAIRAVVDRLYQLILADPELTPYFAGIDLPHLKRHMVALLAHTLGGPEAYNGRSLSEAHAGLRVTAAHYARVGDYVLAALLIAHAARDIVDAVDGVLGSMAPDIVAASAPRVH